MTESFIQRVRWKVFYFFNGPSKKPKFETYGFKTPNNAPSHNELTNFESDMSKLVSNIVFNNSDSSFQKKMKSDLKQINKSKEIFVKADKTSNIYSVSKQNYEKLLTENITAHYKKAEASTEKEINIKAKEITEKLNISNRVEPIAHKNAFITLKDHKDRFPNNIKCRLLNPTKSNIGIISKKILEKINFQIRSSLNLQQWRSTQDTIDWFKNLNITKDSFSYKWIL